MKLTCAIPVTEMGTPWLVYTVGLSTCNVIVFNDILFKKDNLLDLGYSDNVYVIPTSDIFVKQAKQMLGLQVQVKVLSSNILKF